jgi:uncharacterized membrane protein
MMRTVITTGVLAIVILVVIVVLEWVAGTNQNIEYLQFGLSLLMFLVIIFGSYWFVVRGPGGRM